MRAGMISFYDFARKALSDAYLIVIVGDRGSGKTNMALALAENASASRKLFVIPAQASAQLGDVAVISLEKLTKLLPKLRSAFVIIDEGLLALNARERQRKIGLLLAKVSAIGRHRDIRIVITTQATRLDVQILELTDLLAVKKTSLARLLLLQRPPKWITKIDEALRRRSRGQISIETLKKDEAVAIGSVTGFIYGIPKAKTIDLLSKRAADHELSL